jgi:hypothetical protein
VTSIMHAFGGFIICLIMLMLLRVATSESMIPRPCFQPLKHRLLSVLLLVTLLPFLFQITKTTFYHHCWGGVSCTCTPSTKLFSGIVISTILISLRRPSAPPQLTIVLGVLGTQETSCILIAGLLERDTFNLHLPEFDKPLVTHLREICCCPTNLCAWRPNIVYKNRSV